MNTGIIAAALAFLVWGLFPLSSHALGEVTPMEILAHRMAWSLLFVAIVRSARRQGGWLHKRRGPP